jgi:cytochrome d ubiquinol oxidase subunit II
MSVLPLIWIGIIGFCVIMYVILDGFTLGTGLLLPVLNSHQRDIATSVILPTWDGNQTWLVLGMASLYGAFPLAFSILLPALYLPLLFMVVALLFRGVAFEFRLKSTINQHRWDWVFFLASVAVTFVQGSIVGNMVIGFGGAHDYVNSFAILTGIGLVIAYMLLGATRLILKTEAQLQLKMYRVAKFAMLLTTVAFILVCILTPMLNMHNYSLWLSYHNWPMLFWLPLVMCALGLSIWISLYRKNHYLPYWLSVFFVLCPYIGFVVNIYPYVIPYTVTIWQAASPPSTLRFLLVGTSIMLPVLLIYTGYAYHIFRGKVNVTLHY